MFLLQGVVFLLSTLWLILYLYRGSRRGTEIKLSAVDKWKCLGISMVLLSAFFDILYSAADPYWHQWDTSRAGEAFLYLLGDIFLAFDCAAYLILVSMFLLVRKRGSLSQASSIFSSYVLWQKILFVALFAFPFVTMLIAFIIRMSAPPELFEVAQTLFFVSVVVVCIIYSLAIIISGSMTIWDLKKLQVDGAKARRNAWVRRLAIQYVVAAAVLFFAIVCLIVFVTAPISEVTDPVLWVWIIQFCPQLAFFLTQIPILYVFRPRSDSSGGEDKLSSPSGTMHAASGGDGQSMVSGVIEL